MAQSFDAADKDDDDDGTPDGQDTCAGLTIWLAWLAGWLPGHSCLPFSACVLPLPQPARHRPRHQARLHSAGRWRRGHGCAPPARRLSMLLRAPVLARAAFLIRAKIRSISPLLLCAVDDDNDGVSDAKDAGTSSASRVQACGCWPMAAALLRPRTLLTLFLCLPASRLPACAQITTWTSTGQAGGNRGRAGADSGVEGPWATSSCRRRCRQRLHCRSCAAESRWARHRRRRRRHARCERPASARLPGWPSMARRAPSVGSACACLPRPSSSEAGAAPLLRLLQPA